MKKKIGQFQTQAANGQIFTVFEYQDIVNSSTLDDPFDRMPGLKSFLTSDGMTLAYKYDETYEILELGLIVRRMP